MVGIDTVQTGQPPNSSRIITRLERVRDGARNVLLRLDSGEKLSSILGPAKAVVEEQSTRSDVAFWLELEAFGLSGGPYTTAPFKTAQEKAGGLIFMKLRSVRVSTEPIRDERELLTRDKILHDSVGELERQIEEWQSQWEAVKDDYLNNDELQALQFNVELNKQRERVLSDVRSHLYDSIARLRRNADTELENMALLGPDYGVVLDSMDALSTDFRQELVAALENLSSPNPAAWSGAALLCRNVVLSLGRTLFTVSIDSYESELDGKTLDLKGQKELNRLLAFIDRHWRKATNENRAELETLGVLAASIYGRGSAGKERGKVRHEQAQQLVVDAFELVAGLNKLTGLEPIESL